MSGLQVAEFFNRTSFQSVRKTLGDAMTQKVALAFHLSVKYGEDAFPTQSGKLP
jgi:hypothetical protein